MFSTTAIGFLFSQRARTRVEICTELLQLCDLLILDVSFINTPLTELINGFSFKYLDFLTIDNIVKKRCIKSPLTSDENREISTFLYSLGKSGPESQKTLIKGFKEYVNHLMSKYTAEYEKNSKLYLSFGFFSGALISLVLI